MIRAIRYGFLFLLGWELMTAVINVTNGRWDWVAVNVACAAIIAMCGVVAERNATSIGNLHRDRQEHVLEYQELLMQARLTGNEDAERYALQMLAIWSGKSFNPREDGGPDAAGPPHQRSS